MIGFILDQIISPFWPYIAAAGAALLAYLTGRSSGAAKVKAKQAEARADAVIRGAEGAADAAKQINAGKTPQEVKDANDAAWR